jgi:hypothetical protein
MIEEKPRVPNPTRYEVVDKTGRVRKPLFSSAWAAGEWARAMWPDQEQDEDRTGKGWDVQICGCE